MNKAVRITLRQIYIYTADDLDKYAYVHISYYKRREGKGMGGWRSHSILRAASASVASRFLKWAHLEGGGLWANSKRCVMGYRHGLKRSSSDRPESNSVLAQFQQYSYRASSGKCVKYWPDHRPPEWPYSRLSPR